MVNITWDDTQFEIEERGARAEPVLTVVRVDGLRIGEVKITSEALEDHRFARCRAMVERKIRAALARGLHPREIKVEVRTGDFAPATAVPAAAF